MSETTNATATVVGFSSCGDVTLLVNGGVAGVKTPDAVKVVRWEAVPLAEGENVIELRAGGRSSVRTLRRVAAKNEYEST